MNLSVARMAKDCNWVAQEDQRVLLVGCQADGKQLDEELRDSLKAVSTVRCDSVLFDLNYGNSSSGQYFACTVDMIMHAFEARVVAHVLKVFVSSISVARQGLIDRLVDIMFGSHRCSEKDTFP